MKNIVKYSVVLMLMVSLLTSISSLKAYADNLDTAYTFVLDPSNNGYTGARVKDNDSSCYMYCKASNSSYVGKVYGGEGIGGAAYDCSGGFRYYFASGYKRFMYNFVHEENLSVAFIQGHFSTNNGTASGYWSPDSVYESGVKTGSDYIH